MRSVGAALLSLLLVSPVSAQESKTLGTWSVSVAATALLGCVEAVPLFLARQGPVVWPVGRHTRGRRDTTAHALKRNSETSVTLASAAPTVVAGVSAGRPGRRAIRSGR